MKKIVKTILLGCLVILPLFALSACSSRSHFATQKDQWQTYTKEKKIKKILTKEQYEKWQTEQNSARKKASQRRMHKDNHPDKGPDFEQKSF